MTLCFRARKGSLTRRLSLSGYRRISLDSREPQFIACGLCLIAEPAIALFRNTGTGWKWRGMEPVLSRVWALRMWCRYHVVSFGPEPTERSERSSSSLRCFLTARLTGSDYSLKLFLWSFMHWPWLPRARLPVKAEPTQLVIISSIFCPAVVLPTERQLPTLDQCYQVRWGFISETAWTKGSKIVVWLSWRNSVRVESQQSPICHPLAAANVTFMLPDSAKNCTVSKDLWQSAVIATSLSKLIGSAIALNHHLKFQRAKG